MESEQPAAPAAQPAEGPLETQPAAPVEGPLAEAPAAPAAYQTNILNDSTGANDSPAANDSHGAADPEAGADESFEITLPDGFVADEEAIGFLKGMVRDGGMTRESAQKLADQHMAAIERYEAHRFRKGNEQIQAWENEMRSHPEYGGARFAASVETAKNVLHRYGSPKLVKDFNDMGVLSHPEFMYMLMRMSRDVSDGASIGGAGQATPERSAASVLYPDFK